MLNRNALLILVAVCSLVACASCAEDVGEVKTLGEAPQTELAPTKVASADGVTAYQGDLELGTLVSGSFDKRLAHHVWSLDATAGSELFVDLASRAGDDMFLMIYQARADRPGYDLLDYNDDCYDGTLNSCATLTVAADGELLLVASTFDYIMRNRRTPASYDLLVSCQGGSCAAPVGGQACGSRGLEPCPSGTFCDFATDGTAEACGATDKPGVCQPRPEACIQLYDPVCGCDGNTYGNGCTAASSGVDVAYTGECEVLPPEPVMCGGIAGFTCPDDQVCDMSANAGCFPDAAGVCVTPDPTVICTREYAPVCGCDGVTYGNDCERAAAYVAKAHDGECR